MKKIISISITCALIIGLGIVLFGRGGSSTDTTPAEISPNVEVRDGVQYVSIFARGGYTPRTTIAHADIPTKLVMKTNGTYDCSTALVIRSIGYQTYLQPTGEEVISLGTPRKGRVQGVCSMGMYSFAVHFQ